MFLALREIRHQPARFLLITAVIALVGYMTFFLAALAVGLAHSYRASIDSWDASAVVLTTSSNQNVAASRLSDDQVSAVSSTAEATGLEASTLIAQAGVIEPPLTESHPDPATKADVYAFGIDLDGGLSPTVTSGRAITDPATEVLLDDSLAQDGWKVGDTLTLSGTDLELTVVGLTHDQTFQAAPVMVVDADTLTGAASETFLPAVNAVVLTGSEAEDAGTQVAASLPADAELDVLSPGAFIQTLPGYSAQVLTFSLMIGSLVILAALVLGIFLYVLTLQKRPVLGVLKARGVPTGYLIASGGVQTTLLAATGTLTGLLLTVLTGLVLPGAVPFRLSLPLDALIMAAFILFSVIGGLISVRVVARIDPVEAIA